MISKRKNKTSNFSNLRPAILVLENKSIFKGIGLGYQGEATGEICFNTSLTGYQEIISDPSYAGQIINFTFPHIGNVGTNNEDIESDKIWTRGVIFNSEITNPSNYRSLQNLDNWLKKNKIVGITGLDTRGLTNFIRDKGAPKGTIANNKNGKFNISKLIKKSFVSSPGLFVKTPFFDLSKFVFNTLMPPNNTTISGAVSFISCALSTNISSADTVGFAEYPFDLFTI